jgi:phosphoribosylaminoimidazole-succinocarboxamide synthase
MSRLNQVGIDTHFVRILNMREQLVRATESLPFSVTIHNVTSGDFAKKLGLQEGLLLPKPIPEFFLRSPELGNPIVTPDHLTILGWCRFEEVDDILLSAQRINDFLNGQFLMANIRLLSVTLEFGRLYASGLTDPQIVLTDEISPDTCAVIDLATGKRLDWQGVQDNPEQMQKIYQDVARRLGVLGLDTSERLSSKSSEASKRLYKEILMKRKKPHGHNSQ